MGKKRRAATNATVSPVATKSRRDLETKEHASSASKRTISLLWLWGDNGFGQIGFGPDIMERKRPVLSTLKDQILDVGTGGMHTMVITMDGSIWSFGVNDEGALGRVTTESISSEDSDPTIPGLVEMPNAATKAQNVVCTDSASFILTEDGSVFGCGTFRNSSGVFGFNREVELQTRMICVYHSSSKGSPVVKLSAGGNHIVAILKDGGVLTWGDGSQGQLGRITLSSSRRESVMKKTMLTPDRIEGFRHIHFVDACCGEYTTFLKTSSGKFFGFGLNNSGQLAIPPADGLTNDNTITLEDRVGHQITVLKPTLLEAMSICNIRTVAAGKDHAIGIDEQGRVHSWGAATYGVLGREEMIPNVETATPYPVPALVSEIKKPVEAIACGQIISGCIDCDGELYTWGAALNDMLGVDVEDDILVPKKVPQNQSMKSKKFHKLTFGGQHVALLGQ
eukprot:g5240.t1